MSIYNLEYFFNPRRIAVIGADNTLEQSDILFSEILLVRNIKELFIL